MTTCVYNAKNKDIIIDINQQKNRSYEGTHIAFDKKKE